MCGLSTRKTRTPWLDPEERRRRGAPSQSPCQSSRVEVDVEDVLVALGRVLGVLDRAVGPAVEPLRVLRQPRVVGRALDREVERDLEPELARARDQAVEVVERAELGVDRVWPPSVGADRPRAARIARRRRSACCSGPCVRSGRSGGSAAGRRRRSRARRARGSTSSTPSKPPHERGKSSYQAPKRASSRSTSSSSVPRSATVLAAVAGVRSRRAPPRRSSAGHAERAAAPSASSLRQVGLRRLDLAPQLVAPRREAVDPGRRR